MRRFITGEDKGRRINTWDTLFVPAVHAALHEYVNQHWRHRHASACRVDNNAWLFPSTRRHDRMADHDRRLASSVVQPVLRRAGIVGPHAHCHAFRKGVVTALRRAGNSLDDVSAFVHHGSTRTTEESYVFVPYAEITERLQVPEAWGGGTTGKDDEEEEDLLEACGEQMVELTRRVDELQAREQALVGVLRATLSPDTLAAVSDAWRVALTPAACSHHPAPPQAGNGT